ncbi:MAG: hypothetical protein E6Q97_35190 [Desulfurellales bacterium]|nr:MAG: hypothetical protein E6Q97_35190 [Desulfurellales bacterium]
MGKLHPDTLYMELRQGVGLKRWSSLCKDWPALRPLVRSLEVVYDLYLSKPYYKLRDPRKLCEWAEQQDYTQEDLHTLEVWVFQDITRV